MITLFISLSFALIVLLLGILEFLKEKKWEWSLEISLFISNKKYFRIKQICITGLAIALSWLLALLHINIIPHVWSINISFLPIVIIGFMYGPLYGFAAGVFSNLLFSLIGLNSSYFIGYTLSSGLDGAISGILIYFMLYMIFSRKMTNSISYISSLVVFVILIEIIIGLIIFFNYYDIALIIHKFNITINPILLILILFIGGSLYTVLAILFAWLVLRKYKWANNTIVMIVSSEILRILIIGIVLNSIWTQQKYAIPFLDIPLLKILVVPVDIFIGLIFTITCCFTILKLDKNNYLYILNNKESYEKIIFPDKRDQKSSINIHIEE